MQVSNLNPDQKGEGCVVPAPSPRATTITIPSRAVFMKKAKVHHSRQMQPVREPSLSAIN